MAATAGGSVFPVRQFHSVPEEYSMMQQTYGTKRPMNDAGGLMRRSVVLLAALLLACVLMAGAVSAAEWHDVTTYAELKSNLSDGNYTKLTQDISATANDGRINITGKNSTLDLNGHTLTMTMGTSAFSIGNDTATPQNKATLIVLDSSSAKTGTITSTDNYLFFVKNASIVHLQSGIFQANHPVIAGNANGEWGSPTFIVDSGVKLTSTGSVAVFLPAEGTKATITGTTITGLNGGISIAAGDVTITDTSISVTGNLNGVTGEWPSGPCEDGSAISIHKLTTSYPGDLTLKLLGTTSLTSAHGAAFHNYIGSDQTSLGTVTVTIADTVNFNGKAITSAIFGTTCKGDGGVFQDTSDNKLLYPGLNQTGVTWGGDSTSGYTLKISGDNEKYKLTESFNLKSMTVSGAGATIDGNGKTINAVAGSIKGESVITVSGENSELKNLKVTSSAVFANAGMIITLSGKQSKLTNSEIDVSGATLSTDRDSFHTVIVSGEGAQVSGSTIKAGTGKYSSSQCIVVQGKGISITGNTLTPNTASKYKGATSEEVSSGSIGVRIAQNAEGTTTITGNTITCTVGVESTSMNNGIAIDGVKKAVTITANNNKFILSSTAAKKDDGKKGQVGGFGNAFYVSPASAISSNVITLNANGNKVTGGTYFLYADSDNGGTESYTLSGTIQNNDFGVISGKKYEKTPIGTLTVTTSSLTWTNNIEPAIPDVPSVTPTKNADGSTTIIPGNAEDTAITDNTATIGKTADAAVHLEISGDGVERDATSGAITAPADAVIKAVYQEAPAATASTTTAKFALSIVLNEVVVGKLPTISPAFDEQKAGRIPSGYTAAVMITAIHPSEINSHITPGGIQLTFSVPKTWVNRIGKSNLAAFHIDDTGAKPVEITSIDDASDTVKITVKGNTFSTYALAGYTASASSSGNMNNAFRVLFDTQGGSYVTPATGLSYGDKITAPANPVKDGYTFAGWYKDAACTQSWSFSDSIPGDMTLYAKWTGGSTAQQTTTETAAPTAQPTTKQTTAPVQTQSQSGASATTAAPAATTAAGVSPTLTQAPAPVLGALLGLLAAGVLIRRRE